MEHEATVRALLAAREAIDAALTALGASGVDQAQTADQSDLLYGLEEIARYLRMTPRQAKHRAASKAFPTFKVGHSVCARRSTLATWFAEQERQKQA